ncbi:MAG TPA: helix-turn-helix domain-containing protein [Acidimicrobiales bacterium]|nr:helix-turn-helix domain-containing protein [Acidimicrobiales bacterium]
MFEQLGLSGSESRVLLGLLQLGSANPRQVAEHCELGRTNVYPVLETLSRKRLAFQLPGSGALWSAPPADEVVDRLKATMAERFRALNSTAEEAREALAQMAPQNPAEALPYVHRIDAPSQVMVVFNEILRAATDEVLMFDRPPYSVTPGSPNPEALAVLARGVACRSLVPLALLEEPRWAAYREEREAYIEAGLEVRVSEDVPMKMVLVDRSVCLVALTYKGSVENDYPTVLVVEHEGFARVQADAFEARWARARPYRHSQTPRTTTTPRSVTSAARTGARR